MPNLTIKHNKGIQLRYKPYELRLKHVFTISGNSRSSTPVVLTEVEFDGVTGYGEASMPPYLGENHDTVLKFLSKVNMEKFNDPLLIEEILDYVENIGPGNYAAKAAIDIALHDLAGKLLNKPWFRILGLDPLNTPETSFTIGIDKPDIVKKKVFEASPYSILKVKLGVGDDRKIITTIREINEKPVCVDVNQGWKDKIYALEMIHWLHEQNVIFIEQPMPKEMINELAWLTQKSPIPVIADEGLQTFNDLPAIKGVYSGINIKLMKCGGMQAAFKIAQQAHKMDLKVMIGCMTETSCAISAAAQLSPMAEWADLDGNLLISNDCFDGVKISNGKIILNEKPGIGVTPISMKNT